MTSLKNQKWMMICYDIRFLKRTENFTAVFDKFISNLFHNGKILHPNIFKSDKWPNYSFQIEMKREKRGNGNLAIHFKFKDLLPGVEYDKKFEIYILNSKHEKIKSNGEEDWKVITIEAAEVEIEMGSMVNFYFNANTLLTDDNLTILIKISSLENVEALEYNLKIDDDKIPLYDGLLKHFKTGKFSDVVIVVDGTELKAHKLILSAQSPIFSAMFIDNRWKEAVENRIFIEDMDVEVVKQILEFMYTGNEPSGITEFAYELLVAADKYNMDRLIIMCEKILIDNISSENAIETLIVADLCRRNILKEKTIEYISNNSILFSSSVLEKFHAQYRKLANDVFRKLYLL